MKKLTAYGRAYRAGFYGEALERAGVRITEAMRRAHAKGKHDAYVQQIVARARAAAPAKRLQEEQR